MRVLALGAALLVLVACYGGGGDVRQAGAAAAHDPAVVQRAIDSSLARFATAITTGDTAGMLSVYTDDAIVLPANAPAAQGRAAIAQFNAGMLSLFSVSNPSFTTTDLIVTGDYAIETGIYRMTMRPRRAGPAIADTGKYVAVWQRQADGSWKMIRDIFNTSLSQH